MSYFHWQGLSLDGQDKQGLMLAATKEAAALKLAYQQIALLQLKKTQPQSIRLQQKFIRELITKLAIFTHHGLSLHQALTTVKNQTAQKFNQANASALFDDITSGQLLADSIKINFPQTPDYIYTLIKTGEENSSVSHVLSTLAHYLSQKEAILKKIRSIITPPLLTLIFTLLIIIILMVGVVPQFEKLFISLEKNIPHSTECLIKWAHELSSPFFYIKIGLYFYSFFLIKKILLSREKINFLLDALIIKTPFIGPILIRNEFSKFFKMIGILTNAGLPLQNACSIAKKSASNKIISAWLEEISQEIKHGKHLPEAIIIMPHSLKKELYDLLSPTVKLGTNQATLSLITETLENEVFKSIERGTAVISPLLLLIVGGIIFTILIFLYMPLFNLANTI